MNTLFVISSVCLWILVLLLLLGFAVLARQVGLLHRRMGPLGARMMNDGPSIGEIAPVITARDIASREITIGGSKPHGSLLVFLSATCSSCEDLVPALRSIARSDRGKDEIVVLGLNGDDEANRQFVRHHHLEHITYIIPTWHPIPNCCSGLNRNSCSRDRSPIGTSCASSMCANQAGSSSSLWSTSTDAIWAVCSPSMESYLHRRMSEVSVDAVGVGD